MQKIKEQPSPIAWAIYRLPYTEDPILLLQTGSVIETLSSYRALNRKEGFVIAPFEITPSQPIVLIHPDQTFQGWKEIESCGFLQNSLSYQNIDLSSPHEKDDLEDYKQAFHHFISALQKKHFHKLVLSRRTTMNIPMGFSLWQTFKKACRRYPHLMIYQCYTPQSGMWMGSSPEIILAGQGKYWHTVSLAGTKPIPQQELPPIWDHKNCLEQQYVSDYLHGTLQSIGTITKEEGPYSVHAGELMHLKTDFYFTIESSEKLGTILEQLHPTPAVCGVPKEKAYRFILDNEGYSRHYYAGFIGWISPSSPTDLYVNLRCMELKQKQAVFYAGGGILPESEYESEYKESKEKMKTMQSIFSCQTIS